MSISDVILMYGLRSIPGQGNKPRMIKFSYYFSFIFRTIGLYSRLRLSRDSHCVIPSSLLFFFVFSSLVFFIYLPATCLPQFFTPKLYFYVATLLKICRYHRCPFLSSTVQAKAQSISFYFPFKLCKGRLLFQC